MAIDMFLKIEGVEGESTDKSHKGEIDILSWSWGMSQSGTTHMGSGGGSGKVSVQDLSLTKYVDAATHALMLGCCKGTHFDQAVLVVRKAGQHDALDRAHVGDGRVGVGGQRVADHRGQRRGRHGDDDQPVGGRVELGQGAGAARGGHDGVAVAGVLQVDLDAGSGERLGDGRADEPGPDHERGTEGDLDHWPPFWTKLFTYSSASDSRTSSISSSSASMALVSGRSLVSGASSARCGARARGR